MELDDMQPENQLVGRNPYNTPCSCGKSMALLALPFVHCPSCHDTYRARKLTPPARCAHCDFNLLMWRRRNNFVVAAPPFP
jgi:DNA-directed RNA polymerase subunit RPC12/RpoP